jgi:hypothetical protein
MKEYFKGITTSKEEELPDSDLGKVAGGFASENPSPPFRRNPRSPFPESPWSLFNECYVWGSIDE